ncbi:hypothetical protein BegalDRAFT_2493 [Beggiatoa alba B18LD]|uniref:Uncharacterized protein n=1 Tax=Beggiatoa alba B18LD TaxID=395493 RepID=I3CI95_9GAMM|nr:hypothetical protein [Beggiatoa alba]EIJ43338.1 hypothetical protein BegalDRAFT_2493 [Beggiatoa alba B18LD]
MPDFSHAMRPTFTAGLYQRLEKGEAINLVTPSIADGSRTLSDIQEISPNDKFLIIKVSLKAYRNDFNGFLIDIWQQLPKEQRGEKPQDFAQLVERLEAISVQKWLFIEAMQAIFDNELIDPLYNQRFLSSLNSLKNNRNYAVVGVSEQPLDRYTIFIDKSPKNASVLELKPLVLPLLSQVDIEAELQRHPDIVRHEQSIIREAVYKHPHAYDFLQFVIQRIENGERAGEEIENKLKVWGKDFNKKPFLTLRYIVGLRQKIVCWLREGQRWLLVPILGSALVWLFKLLF